MPNTVMEEEEGDRRGVDEAEKEETSMEVAPALIAVHPFQDSVAVAVGPELRVFDLKGDCPITLVDDTDGHTDAIRGICYGAMGRYFVSSGDDKLVKVWVTDSWRCLGTVCSEKRVSAVAISQDGQFIVFADKFGVVWIVRLNGADDSEISMIEKPVPLLAHYCSIITCLEFSPDGQFIVTADRDYKIRVTRFPKRALIGAHEIQSFCLGHTDYISCLSFVNTQSYPQGFLISGSGDSTVRLWDLVSGCLLSTCEVGAEYLELNGAEDQECCPAVTDISAAPNGSVIAVAIQSLRGVMLLSCDFTARNLTVIKIVPMKETFIPTCLGMSFPAENLWMVTGACNLPSSPTLHLARVRVISNLLQGNSDCREREPVVLEDSFVPGGSELLEKLQGNLSSAGEENILAAAAEAVKRAMRNLMIKKQYSAEKRESRKKSRNDKKLKQ